MSAVGRFFVTSHAVKRYQQRIRPGLSYEEALGELVRLTSEGRMVRLYDQSGAELWRGPRVGTQGDRDARSRVRFVVGARESGLPQVLTILPNGRG